MTTLGYHPSASWKAMMSKRFSGRGNPYFGRKHSVTIRKKISVANKNYLKNHTPLRLGAVQSLASRHKMSLSKKEIYRKGFKAWNTGLSKENNKVLAHMSFIASNPDPELTKRRLQHACPSSLESDMITIIEKLHQPYRFTGDGDVIIGGKCPDFVNCNGKKIALEVFYRGHKEEFRGGLERWKRNRSRVFARYGWKIIYFNEKQVNEKYVLRKLGN